VLAQDVVRVACRVVNDLLARKEGSSAAAQAQVSGVANFHGVSTKKQQSLKYMPTLAARFACHLEKPKAGWCESRNFPPPTITEHGVMPVSASSTGNNLDEIVS
jgi:hypothetical protein